MTTAEPAFLSVIRWPEGLEREDVVGALEEAAGVDPFQARQRLAGGPPCVIQRIGAADAKRVVAELAAQRVHAIAPTLSQLRDLAPPIRAKRLTPAIDAPTPMFLCEPWRGEAFGVPAADIAVLVRARVARSKSSSRMENVATIVDPVSGMVLPLRQAVRESSGSLHDFLDIYLRGRRRIRCAGDKFNFDCLGGARGFSDNENMDKLSVLLADAAPHAIVDLAFADFSCPAILLRVFTSQSGVTTRDDHPAFDFYSPWCILVHRELSRGGPATR